MTRSTAGLPAPPAVARELFGTHLESVITYGEMLAGPGVERGLIGPRETPRLWDRHLLNCGAVAELVPPGASVIDVGSGAGLPGIVIGLMRPDIQVTLLEPLLRRTRFLTECVDRLELSDRAAVVRSRVEELGGSVTGQVVVARAVAPLLKLGPWCLPLVAPGGSFLAIKGDTAQQEVTDARQALRRQGADSIEVVECGAELLATPTTVVRVGVTGRQPGRGPGRRPGGARGRRKR